MSPPPTAFFNIRLSVFLRATPDMDRSSQRNLSVQKYRGLGSSIPRRVTPSGAPDAPLTFSDDIMTCRKKIVAADDDPGALTPLNRFTALPLHINVSR